MTSKRSREGYYMLDSRNAPMPAGFMERKGLPGNARDKLFEAPTYTCSHCQRVVVMNPDRVRERAWCRHCDRYLCDACGTAYGASGGECRSFRRMLDQMQEADARATILTHP